MLRLIKRLVFLLATAGAAGCATHGDLALPETRIEPQAQVQAVVPDQRVVEHQVVPAPAAASAPVTMFDVEPSDDGVLSSVLEGFTTPDWLPYENAQAPPKIALSTTQHTRPRWVFSTNNPSFDLPLQASLIPRSSLGDGTATYSRNSVAEHIDFEAIRRQVSANAFRPQGARYVKNWISGSSEDISNASWTVANGGAGAVTKNANGVTFAGNSGDVLQNVTTAITGGTANKTIVVSATISVASGTANFRMKNTQSAVVDHFSTDLTATTTPTRFSFPFTYGASAGNGAVSGGIANASSAPNSATFIVTKYQIEDVTGQANTNPSDYVPVAATANADSGAVGVRFFSTLNGCTVASNVVTEATGPAITSARSEAAKGVLAGVVDSQGPLGYLAEGAGTQILATADIRDMTTVNWIAGVTMTVARTSIGADGAANSANRLTGGAVAATNTILLTNISAATQRTYSALVKCVTCTGPIRIVQTGTETDISAQLNTSTYKLVQLTASILNVAMGFKIDTAGDAIDVDFNQFEAGAFASSRMAATGAARVADSLTYPMLRNISLTQGAVYAEVNFVGGDTASPRIIGDNGGAPMFWDRPTGKLSIYDGTIFAPSNLTLPLNTVARIASRWPASSPVTNQVFVNGISASESVFDGNMNFAVIGVGSSGAFMTIRNILIWPTSLTAQKAQFITTSNEWGEPIIVDLSDSRYRIAANDEDHQVRKYGTR